MLSENARLHVLKALSALSKFLGIYEEFRALVRNHGLKWTSKNAEYYVIARLTRNWSEDEIIEWCRQIKKGCPELSLFLDFTAATGLRFSEAVESWNLIIKLGQESAIDKYFKDSVLEHFRFKELFMRPKKKAFISIVPDSMIQAIQKERPLTTNLIEKRLKRRGLKMRFSDLREYYASFMTKYLRESEINLLQGRVSQSVFMQHYFNPALINDLKERVLRGIKEILRKINHK